MAIRAQNFTLFNLFLQLLNRPTAPRHIGHIHSFLRRIAMMKRQNTRIFNSTTTASQRLLVAVEPGNDAGLSVTPTLVFARTTTLAAIKLAVGKLHDLKIRFQTLDSAIATENFSAHWGIIILLLNEHQAIITRRLWPRKTWRRFRVLDLKRR